MAKNACKCRRCKRLRFGPWVGKIPVSLPGEPHGQRSLAGYSPLGYKESNTPEHTAKVRLDSSCLILRFSS